LQAARCRHKRVNAGLCGYVVIAPQSTGLMSPKLAPGQDRNDRILDSSRLSLTAAKNPFGTQWETGFRSHQLPSRPRLGSRSLSFGPWVMSRRGSSPSRNCRVENQRRGLVVWLSCHLLGSFILLSKLRGARTPPPCCSGRAGWHAQRRIRAVALGTQESRGSGAAGSHMSRVFHGDKL